MPKCVKCGYENKWRNKECVNCGTKLFMGMTVIKTYKYNIFQKFLIVVGKYIFLFVGIYFLWECFSVLSNFKDDTISCLMSFIVLLIFNAPFILGSYFAIRMCDYALKNSDHPDSIDLNKKNKDNNYDKNML